MSVDDTNKAQLQLYSESISLMSYHGRHSYKVFKNLISENCDLSKTLLNNCNLQDCIFVSCKMNSIDYQGTEFYNCKFINVSFKGADISSCIFKYCNFENCEFDSTNIIDNNISNSIINSTEFNCATVNNNIWTNCEFISFDPEDTSIYSNEFIKCKFTNCGLLSAIYYTIFDKCFFISSKIDSYILGFQFGLRLNDFKNLEIEHFGEENVDIGNAKRMMHTVYDDRKMPLENHILDLIFANNIGLSVENLVNVIFCSLNKGYVVKVDELRFIRRIINNLYRGSKISLFYYIFMIEKLREFPLLNYRKILSDNMFNEIMLFYNLLYSIKMEIEMGYKELCETLSDNLIYFNTFQVELIYNKRPSYRISEIVQEITNQSFFPIKETNGSFHEYYEITKEILEFLSVIITITGTSITAIIVALKKFIRKKKSSKEKPESTKQKIATSNSLKTNNEIIVEEYASSMTFDIVNIENRIEQDRRSAFIRETIYHQTVQTVVIHKEQIVSNYDKKNFKKINFK